MPSRPNASIWLTCVSLLAALRVAASASVPAAGYLGGGRWEAGLQVATDAGDTSAAVRGTELALTLALRLPME